MTHQEAIEKVAKLMRLAQSANEHEAALAAQRAQEIMAKFKIDSIMLEQASKTDADSDNEPIMNFGDDVLYDGPHARATFRVRLASHIAAQNQVKIYLLPRGVALVGRPSDCTTVRYLYGYFHREVLRLCNEKCKGNSDAYRNAWKNGCVATIGVRLASANANAMAAARQEGNSLALVRVQNALEVRAKRTEAFFEELTKEWKAGKQRKNYHNSEAYHRGRQDGHSVRMTNAKGSLGGGSKQQIGGGK